MAPCAVCGMRDASFVCHNCGRTACQECFDTNRWRCSCCNLSTSAYDVNLRGPPISASGLFLLAFAMIFVGVLLMSFAPMMSGESVGSVGTVILIGPIPIILGSGPLAGVMVVLALVLTIVVVVLGLVVQRWRR